jgi:hypothetical protein
MDVYHRSGPNEPPKERLEERKETIGKMNVYLYW